MPIENSAEFDVGPLSWVAGEIDQALTRGLDGLAAFKAAPRDATPLKHARAHVHQAAGAIQMVGLDAVVPYIDEIERGLARLEESAQDEVPAMCDAIDRACRKLKVFLGEVVMGAPLVALKLLPEYEAMQQARGIKTIAATDLFYPDLTPRAPVRLALDTLPDDALGTQLVRQRRAFQQGLLLWLRGNAGGAKAMRDAVAAIEALTAQPNLRAFWWTVGALLEALVDKGLAPSFGAKQLAARIDLQIRRLVEGSSKVADRLRREVLYYVAISSPVTPTVREVQQTFGLAGLIPSATSLSADVVRLEPLLRAAREQIGSAKEAWLKFASGRVENLPRLRQTMAAVQAQSVDIGDAALTKLTTSLAARLEAMPAMNMPEALAMEYATGLLLAESAFENYASLTPDFPAQVDAMLARLDAVQANRPLVGAAAAPMLDEMSRRAQERLLLAQVVREIQVNLRRIEQVLDAFFRDHGKRAELASLSKDSRQIGGALRMLGLEQADQLLGLCQAQIESYATPEAAVSNDDLELLAESLSSLGFYVEAVEQQRPDRERLIAPLLARLLGHAPAETADDRGESIETAVDQLRISLPEIVAEVHRTPADAAARAGLRDKLADLRDDAQLMGDESLAAQAGNALKELAAGGERALAAAVDAIAESGAAAPAPEISAETQRLLAADEHGLDAEFLDIYLTEAGEVLDTVAEHRAILERNPGTREALRTVRRGFHTLKGSGRMVGLTDLGEIAFEAEKILNVLLEEERAITPAVLTMIDVAEKSFRGWVSELQRNGRVRPDATALHAAIRAIEAQLPAGRDSVLAPATTAAAEASVEMPVPVVPTAPAIEMIEFADVGAAGGAPPQVVPEGDVEEIDGEEHVIAMAPGSDEITIGDVTLSASLYRILCDEADQHLAALDAERNAMAFDPSLLPTSAMIRASHTLYGIHRTAGIPLVAYTAKALEQCLLALQQADAPVPAAALPVLTRAIDGIGALVGRVKARIPFGDADETEALEIQYALEALRPDTASGPAVVDAELLAAREAARDEAAAEAEAAARADEAARVEAALQAEEAARAESAAQAEALARAAAIAQAEEAARAEAAALAEATARAEEATRAEAAAQAAALARAADDARVEAAARAEAIARAEEAARLEAAAQAEAIARAEEAARLEAAAEAEAIARAEEAARLEAAAEAEAIARAEEAARLEAAAEAEAIARAEEAARLEAAARAEEAVRAEAAAQAEEAARVETAARTEFAARAEAAKRAEDAARVEAAAQTEASPLADVRDDVDAQILPIFLEEASEIFPRAGEELRAWRRAPADTASAQRLRRALHTFKGSARMAGAMRLGDLTHQMESRLIDGDMLVDPQPALFDLLETDLDRIAFLLDALRRGEIDIALPWVVPAVETFAEDDAPVPHMPVAAAPIVVAAPGVDAVRAIEHGREPNVVPLVPRVPAAPAHAEAADAEVGQRAMLRVRADVIDRLVNEAGEVAITRTRIDAELRSLKANLLELTNSVIRLRAQVREIEIQGESQIQSHMSHVGEAAAGFDPLEFDRYTRFQELTRSLAEGVNDVATVQQSLLKNLDDADAALLAQGRLSRDIQQQLFAIRTVPFGSLSERLYRILRQTARELDKRANLEIRGAQVELDRAVLEKLVGPLEHLLRNALDHGIEARASRVDAGKSETGEIALTVRQVGNEIAIELADDGGGLDFEQIRARAVAQGMIAADAQPTEARLIQCLFLPGFSTATRVTAVSGRGIGMDVVRAEVAALGGRVEVTTRSGAGTNFMLYLPLTLAVAQAVLVRAGGRLWALPAPMVEQVQQIKVEALLDLYIARSVQWQGRSYPFHYLCRLLGDDQSQPETARHNSVLLLRTGPNVAAVHVDEMIGNQEVVVKNIGPQLARVSGIAGATVLGTGEIVLIINPVALAQRAGVPDVDPSGPDRVVSGYLPVTGRAAVAGPPLVMIVDDSLTVRKITGRLLTREGFAVITARDGIDALELLEEQIPEVILLDIEMPRMDGFEFTRTIKRDSRFAHIPVIMITSRTAEKHRSLARELGVDLYLGKPFQEEALLRNLRDMLAMAP